MGSLFDSGRFHCGFGQSVFVVGFNGFGCSWAARASFVGVEASLRGLVSGGRLRFFYFVFD